MGAWCATKRAGFESTGSDPGRKCIALEAKARDEREQRSFSGGGSHTASIVDEHTPVLVGEALAALALQAGGYYVDATFGRGGHTARILQALGREGRVLAIDRDPAGHRGRPRSALPTKCGLRSSMRRLPISPRSCRRTRTANLARGVLFDLGVSSPQLDDPAPRLQLPRGRSARHAYGPDTRRAGLCLARSGGPRRDSRGDRHARRRALRAAHRRRPSLRRAPSIR